MIVCCCVYGFPEKFVVALSACDWAKVLGKTITGLGNCATYDYLSRH